MFIMLPVFDSVARGQIVIAIDPKTIQAIKPASEDPNMCLVYMGDKVWRVTSPFREVVDTINNALKGEK